MTAVPPALTLRLRDSESIACGLHRIAMSETAHAFDQLARAAVDPPAAIHECRKAVKRLRALARLARHRNPAAYRRVDRQLRLAGRALSGQRDGDVAQTTAAELCPALATTDLLTTLRSTAAAATAGEPSTARAARALTKARRRLDTLIASSDEWTRHDLKTGIRTQYRRFRKDAQNYLDSRTPEHAHRFRKNLQRHLAQLRLLDELAVTDLAARINELNELSQSLGTHHDLTVLRTLLRNGKGSVEKSVSKTIRKTARARQRALNEEIAERVPALITLKPSRFARKVVSSSDGHGPDTGMPGGES